MAITGDLADLMADTLVAQAVTTDGFGDITPSGSALNLSCHISGRVRLVRDASGQERVSSVKVTVGSVNSLTVDGFRYTLPARFDPRTDLKALAVQHAADEDGAHHEVVYFP